MSYASEIKKQLEEIPIKKSCCKKSFFLGKIYIDIATEKDNCSIYCGSIKNAELIKESIYKYFSSKFVPTQLITNHKVTLLYSIELYSCYFLPYINEIISLQTKCKECYKQFIKGVFISSGHINNPTNSYNLDFSCHDKLNELCQLFQNLGYVPKTCKRKNENIIYFRDNSVIGELLAMMGAFDLSYEFINTVIEKTYRSDASRRRNIETHNIEKTINSSFKQCQIIQELFDNNYISNLPESLQKTAKLRLEYPDYSLEQLTEISPEPISKSGMNHRIKKILDYANSKLN